MVFDTGPKYLTPHDTLVVNATVSSQFFNHSQYIALKN
jgi:putative N6-adenine-specific DNA methylase